MNRRQAMALLASAVAVWTVAARAQQPAMPVVGFLTSLGRNERHNLRDAFRHGLDEAGYLEGKNVAVEYRFAENRYDRLPALAAELVGRKVAVLAASGGGSSVLAAKNSTTTIPIVFTTAGDPIQEGCVASLNRPGVNITGVSWFNAVLSGKALGLLHELLPNAAVIALLTNPKLPEAVRTLSDAQEAARTLGRQLVVLTGGSPSEVDMASAAMLQNRAGALLVAADPFLGSRFQQIIALAARDPVPAMYFNREFVTEGGLMSYGEETLQLFFSCERV